MRKVILFVNATIDGYLAGPGGELDWMLPDPDMNQQLTDELRGEVDTILSGRALTEVNDGDRLAKGELPDEVASLTAEPGKGMVIFGGVNTVQQFVRHGLVDEYWIKTYPIALGAGQPLFTDLEQRANLKLTQAKAHDSGIVTLRYLPA
jgi:dihydrofolate reductase